MKTLLERVAKMRIQAIKLSDHESVATLLDVHEALVQSRVALKDMLSGWKYIRTQYGDLYGVGWDRAEEKATAALAFGESS